MSSATCHYCGEEYEATTDLEESYLNDSEEHNVCSTCLFDVLTGGEEIEPLPEFREAVEETEEGDR